jgi:short-subunit dehydrogenase
LIHNAGVSQRSLASETNLETDKTIMNVNYFGTITLTKLLLDKMIEKQHGHVVVISSVAGKVGVQYRSAYAASKHALHGFFDSLRAETEPMGIFTTIVCPGYVKTNISLNALKGDGSNYNDTDRNHIKAMEPMVLAEKILKSVKNRKREVYYGGKEILIIYIKRYLPTLYYKIIKKIKP